MNIDKLECGDALNKLIAEKIYDYSDFGLMPTKDACFGMLIGRIGGSEMFFIVPNYSFGISEAFRVACDVGLFDNGNILYRDEDEMWVVAKLNSESVKFDEFEHSTYWIEPEVIAKDSSIPLVICKAVLKMIGEK